MLKHSPGLAVGLWILTAGTAAYAVPPFSNVVNRHLASNASAEHCQFSLDGFVCRSVSAGESDNSSSESPDFGFVNVTESGEDFSAGSQFFRTISCFVGLDVFDASKFGASVQTTVNPNSTDCSTFGSECDTGTGECQDFAYEDLVTVSGNWREPIETFSSRNNRVDSNDVTGETTHAICQDHGGTLMRAGGFEIDGNEVAFDGRSDASGDDDFLFSEFLDHKCLNKQ
jgi:hypothetical protein